MQGGSTNRESNTDLIKGLGLLDAVMLIMGSMIGSGIFIVSADIARVVASPGLLLLIWFLSGLMTVLAALSYGELSAALPHAGGQYVFLREAHGPLCGFLYGWTLFLVIQSGTIAAVAVAFARYLDVFLPLSRQLFTAEVLGRHLAIDLKQLVGVAVILFLSVVNCFGIRVGANVQNAFTSLKVLALVLLIGVGIAYSGGSWNHFKPFLPDQIEIHSVAEQYQKSSPLLFGSGSVVWTLGLLIGVAMIGALFASDAWNNLTFTGGEVRNPQRNLPLALFLGTGLVTLIYLLCNIAYLHVLPIPQISQTDKIAASVAKAILGSTGNAVVSFAILISTFGCLNGLILSGPRVYYAMAKDRLFFKTVAEIHPRYHTPVRSLGVQAVWASLLTLSGTYSQLLTYVISAALLFYILTVYGLIRLRRTQPDLPRPYKAVGYPYLPWLYVIMAAAVLASNLIGDPSNSWPGFIIIAVGLPAYFYWKRKSSL
jgi:APA family basic amino acid/polyamine antiporter